jgi:hypothetical protein
MEEKYKKNKAPLAPTSAEPSNASGSTPRVAPVEKGTLVKRKGNHDQDPTIENHKVKPHVKATSGARYGVHVKFQKTEAPEAGATQGNGRLLPPAIKRSSQSFGAGMSDHA